MNKDINRIKLVLAEKKRTNKWFAEQLGCAPTTLLRYQNGVSTLHSHQWKRIYV